MLKFNDKVGVWGSGLRFKSSIFRICLDKDKKIKKLCLTSRFETDNISSVELLLRHNK